MGPLGYRPALDGLRGIAILLVISWHAFGWPAGGAGGVDLFFVLSGFLITTLLLEEHDRTGTVSLRQFYRRRVLRLFPALAALLIVCGTVTVVADREHLPAMLRSIAFTAVYAINIAVADLWSVSGALGHMWSLAAEEQFYVVWPIVLLLLVRRRVRVSVGLLCVLLALAVVWRAAVAVDGASFDRVYYGPDTHVDPLLVGCLFGIGFARGRLPRIVTSETSRRRLTILALITIAALAGGVVSNWALYASPLITLLSLAAGVIVVSACLDNHGLTTVLRTRPLVWLGRVSYSLYLWHLPVLVAFGGMTAKRGLLMSTLALLVALTAAALSHYTIERYFLRRKHQARQKPQQPEFAPAVA